MDGACPSGEYTFVPAVLASAAAILLGVLLLTLPDEFALAFVAALAAAVWLIPVRRAKR